MIGRCTLRKDPTCPPLASHFHFIPHTFARGAKVWLSLKNHYLTPPQISTCEISRVIVTDFWTTDATMYHQIVTLHNHQFFFRISSLAYIPSFALPIPLIPNATCEIVDLYARRSILETSKEATSRFHNFYLATSSRKTLKTNIDQGESTVQFYPSFKAGSEFQTHVSSSVHFMLLVANVRSSSWKSWER